MIKRNEILFKCFVILLIWMFLGYFFYHVWFYITTKCTQIFNSELLFGASITLGALNGICSAAILEFIVMKSKKNLIKLFFSLHIIVIFISFILNLNWLIYMFVLFIYFGFTYMYLEFNPQN